MIQTNLHRKLEYGARSWAQTPRKRQVALVPGDKNFGWVTFVKRIYFEIRDITWFRLRPTDWIRMIQNWCKVANVLSRSIRYGPNNEKDSLVLCCQILQAI